MAYVQSRVMKKRLQEKRRVSGAALLREDLNAEPGDTSSLLDSLPVEKDKGVIMANFEEWIKMATDNKINTTNSWNFALIDYFHDMDVLRGKDNNINFQKASATLDGCVKIYSSRVDSVATETGRLLSGLATRKESTLMDKGEGDDEEELSDDEVLEQTDTNSKKKKTAKAKARDSGYTLTTLEHIKIKTLSQELSIDPMFKKTLAEFDEGGAKSLLLNTLHIDKHSRVVFDASSTNANDVQEEEQPLDVEMSGMEGPEVDISPLKSFLFFDVEELETKTLCPSIEQLNSVLKDINKAKSILNGFVGQDEAADGQNNHDYLDDLGDADQFYNDSNANSYGDLENEAAVVIFQDELDANHEQVGNDTGVVASVVDQDLMAYFDSTMKRSWAGPEHWKVTQLKKDKVVQSSSGLVSKQKKVKEVFTMDFMAPMEDDLEEKLFQKGKASTQLPVADRESKNNHLLPDDLYFSSDQLTKLFSKPDQKLHIFRRKINVRSVEGSAEPDESKPADATFWADNYKDRDENPQDDDFGYDNNDFGGLDDAAFDVDSVPADEKVTLGTQLITGRAKPEYLNYSKKAKNVNVKRLKDNIWKSIEVKNELEKEMQFSELVTDIAKMYPVEQKKDLSTSFCFICLLHLANEHSLTIENNEALDDLKVTGYGTN